MPGSSQELCSCRTPDKLIDKATRKENLISKLRLLACLARKRGHSIRRISSDLKRSYSTVRDLLLWMRDRRLRGRLNLRPKGQRVRLTL